MLPVVGLNQLTAPTINSKRVMQVFNIAQVYFNLIFIVSYNLMINIYHHLHPHIKYSLLISLQQNPSPPSPPFPDPLPQYNKYPNLNKKNRKKMYSTFTTRNRQLAQKLTKKLDGSLTQTYDHIYKQQLYEHRTLDNKYKECAEKLKIFKTKNQRFQHQLHQDLEGIQDVLFVLERNRNRVSDLPLQAFQGFEKFVQGEQVANSEKMNIVRKGMIEDIDKKKKTMKTDAIEIIQQEFQEFCKSNLTDITKKLSTIHNLLQQQKQNRQESASELAHNIGQQILKMEHMIAEEREQRKYQNQVLFDLMADIQDKLDRQVREEVGLREKCQEQMEGRLGEICMSIQSKIIGG